MSNLTIFQFESNQVRIVTIDGEPWFIANDVLKATDSTTTVTALKRMISEDLGDEFVSNQVIIDTMKRKQKMLCLSEAALTFFVARSRTELGKQMNRWIHSEVLPSIRKTGSYSLPDELKRLPEWHGMRRSGVDVRKTLTESIEIYKERHPEMSANKKKFLYKNTTDQLNRQRFGKQAKQLREERGLSKNQPLRDSMSIDELFDVKRIECLAVELILQFDFYPPDAIIEAMNRMLIPMLKAAR